MAGLKGLTINTSPEESAHIYAEDDAAIFESIVGTDGVMNIGQSLAATIVSNNKVKIADGVVCVGGHFARIPYGDYCEVDIENGQSGKYRNDIIVVRFETTGIGGVDEFQCVVIKGTAGDVAADPAVTQYNLYQNGVIREFPLYRVKIEGLEIAEIEPMFELKKTIPQLNEELASTNEELASTNEELTSTNKKLASTNEELTSLSKELASTNAKFANYLQYKLVSKTTARIIYKIGNVIYVQGTVVKTGTGKDYVLLFTSDELDAMLGTGWDSNKIHIATKNGESAAAQARFYTPEIWRDSSNNNVPSVYQYFTEALTGSIRIDYFIVCNKF